MYVRSPTTLIESLFDCYDDSTNMTAIISVLPIVIAMASGFDVLEVSVFDKGLNLLALAYDKMKWKWVGKTGSLSKHNNLNCYYYCS